MIQRFTLSVHAYEAYGNIPPIIVSLFELGLMAFRKGVLYKKKGVYAEVRGYPRMRGPSILCPVDLPQFCLRHKKHTSHFATGIHSCIVAQSDVSCNRAKHWSLMEHEFSMAEQN